MCASTASGSTWSWTASNTNTSVEGILDVEPSGVAHLERDVRRAAPAGLGACRGRSRHRRGRSRRTSTSGTRARARPARGRCRRRRRRPECPPRAAPSDPAPAAGTASTSPPSKNDAADAVHHVGELGAVLRVRNAAALAERPRDLVHVLAEVGAQRGHRREVHRPVGEHGGVRGRAARRSESSGRSRRCRRSPSRPSHSRT